MKDFIKSYIDNFQGSEQLRKMIDGENYYRSKNTRIMNRKMFIYAEDEDKAPYRIEDPYKSNNKLPSGFLKILIDQKINYSLGKDISFETEDELEELEGFQKTLKQAAKEASKKGLGWGHVYIDEGTSFKLKRMKSEQIIPVYSTYDDEQLEYIIRFYSVNTTNKNNETIEVTRIEVWDKDFVTYYEKTEQGNIEILTDEDMYRVFKKPYSNPKYHFEKNITYGKEVVETEGLSWGMIPFIPLYNNDEEQSDLDRIVRYIDGYDIVNSDFMNNLEDFADVYWILKGYEGTDLNKFLDQVKKYRTLKVGEGGDARPETIDIPVLARKEAKEGLVSDIYNFGMGVNPNMVGDGNVTNVVIKARYSNLDLKAAQFETEVKDFINKFMKFLNRYRELNKMPEAIINKITFNRSIIINEVELLDANMRQNGSISNDTRLANNPWVSNSADEQEKMDKEETSNSNVYSEE